MPNADALAQVGELTTAVKETAAKAMDTVQDLLPGGGDAKQD